MNSIKKGVKTYGVHPEMIGVRGIVQSVFNKRGYPCVVTSCIRTKKGEYSLHPFGFAEDYRTKHIMNHAEKMMIVTGVKSALPNCDVILEHLGEPKEHLHVEFDDHDDELFQRHKAESKRTGVWPTK